MTAHRFTIEVSGCTREQAEQVIGERVYHDEDYGFNYGIQIVDGLTPLSDEEPDDIGNAYCPTCQAYCVNREHQTVLGVTLP